MLLGARAMKLGLSASALLLGGCCFASPPASQFPTAGDAIGRMRATYSCSRGIAGEAKIDYFDEQGRVRGNLLFTAALPDRMRFTAYSPFGVTLSTLTTDGQSFALFDMREKVYLHGPANACNMARFSGVPIPPYAMATLMRGEAPVLVHTPEQARIEWDCDRYVISISSKHGAKQEIGLVPTEADWNRPWQEQRVRVLEVRVEQHGRDLYRAQMKDHELASSAKPIRDPDGLGPALQPSGPACSAEVPRRVLLEVPDTDRDVRLDVKQAEHNPPLGEGVFEQSPPRGVQVRYAPCR